MAPIDANIGTLVLAAWMNCSLLTLECSQIIMYFRKYPRDSWFNRISVIAALITDLACTAAIMSAVYLYCITHWGDVAYMSQTQPISIPIFVISTGFTGVIVQSWLTVRIYKLTKKWWLVVILALPIGASIAGSVGGGILAATVELSARESISPLITLWVATAVGADICITLVLVIALSRVKSEFTDTGNIIRRLMIASVRNGSLTAGIAVIALITWSLQPNNNISVMFESIIGRVYTMTMLANLNGRAEFINNDSSGGRVPSGPGGQKATGGQSARFGNNVNSQRGGVNIHQEIETRIEGAFDADIEQGQGYESRPYDEGNSVNKLDFESDSWERGNDHSEVELVRVSRK